MRKTWLSILFKARVLDSVLQHQTCLRRKKCPSCFKGIYCFVNFLFHYIWTWSYMHLSILNGSPKALKPLLRVYEWYACVSAQLLQSYPTLCDPMDCSPLGSSVHGIIQARILEWVVISYFRGSSGPRDQSQGSNPRLLCLLHWQVDSLPLGSLGSLYWEQMDTNWPKKYGKFLPHECDSVERVIICDYWFVTFEILRTEATPCLK